MTRILIIDDNPSDVDTMNGILTEAGYTTCSRPSGLNIQDYLLDHKPDLIMLDLVMPKMNGIEILRQLKNKYPDIPVVMCSAAEQEQVVALAIRVGASGYVVKPYQKEELLNQIRGIITEKSG